MRALPAIATRVSSNPDAYVYLAESIRAWPDQAGLAAKIGQTDWSDIEWRNLTGGIVALHRAVKRWIATRRRRPARISRSAPRSAGRAFCGTVAYTEI